MRVIKQDILDVTAGVIVHQVNPDGVMGAGLAKAIARKWPHVEEAYKESCHHSPPEFHIGSCLLVRVSNDLYVCNMFSQKSLTTPQPRTSMSAMMICLMYLSKFSNVYLPWKIGCGLGGGNWDQVVNTILGVENDTNTEFTVCKL